VVSRINLNLCSYASVVSRQGGVHEYTLCRNLQFWCEKSPFRENQADCKSFVHFVQLFLAV
jgi:hypothetical protein